MESSSNRQIARAAGLVMVAFIVSNIIGLLRQILVAGAFGTGMEIEAFAAANRVSETLFNLVAGGALGSAFIPTFTGILARDDRRGAWKLASATANLILVILTLAAALAAIFAPFIVRYLLAPGFDPEKTALTVSLMRLMLPSVVLFGLSGLVIGILNSHQVFFIPALTPSMYALGMIFGVLVLKPYMGIYGLAWGVLIGASLHLGLQIPSLLRLKPIYFPTFGLRLDSVREVVRLFLPRLLGVAVVQLNFWINVWLASRMIEGSINGVSYAFALFLTPLSVIAQSIAIAAMPTFSAQAALGHLSAMRNSLAASLRGVLLLAIPATFGMILLRTQIITVLYQRGEFTAFSTELVAWALLWYGIGLVGHSVVEIVSRAFYALHDTKTPVFVGIGAMSLNIVFSLLFAALFERLGWLPLGGLALANSLATTLEMAGLLWLMRRRLSGLEGAKIFKAASLSVAAALVMTGCLLFWLTASSGQPVWLVAAIGILIGGSVYAGMLFVLGVGEMKLLSRVVWQRIRR
jgi:putative peptidoglycan lipid II flippase